MSGLVTLVSIIFLGFFLGMRHATDADHVIAVSTIVSREHTLRSAILIGSAWGVGHTLTIVGVGGALILFSVVIPPRLGLSMEMAVGLMLIVLGLAGSAAIALLVLATIQNAWWATAYLLLFGLGTIAGMMLVTAAIAAPFAFAAQRLGGLTRYLRVASGLLSLGFGLFLVYQIGFVNGLFTGRPHWTPR